MPTLSTYAPDVPWAIVEFKKQLFAIAAEEGGHYKEAEPKKSQLWWRFGTTALLAGFPSGPRGRIWSC